MRVCPGCRRAVPERCVCATCGPLARVAREAGKTVTLVFAIPSPLADRRAAEPRDDARRDVRYFDGMRAALERHGGTVEKFIGDAVMAVFGLPVRHEDDAVRAIRAAADMQAALPALNAGVPSGLGRRAAQPHRRQQRRGHRRRRRAAASAWSRVTRSTPRRGWSRPPAPARSSSAT